MDWLLMGLHLEVGLGRSDVILGIKMVLVACKAAPCPLSYLSGPLKSLFYYTYGSKDYMWDQETMEMTFRGLWDTP